MKEKNRFSIYLSKPLSERLIKFCGENHGVKKSTIISMALTEWLEREEQKQNLEKEAAVMPGLKRMVSENGRD